MARIRKIEIANFRGIRSLTWLPAPGINCLIGPGDNGKSTVLDAIDLCLGARRNAQFSDADFFNLVVKQPINISLTIGALDDALKNFWKPTACFFVASIRRPARSRTSRRRNWKRF